MSHRNCRSSIAIVTKQKAPSLSGRKGSFEGHWSGSYCPGGRQIGPVKPHCESDWNWFVVLLLHHPIKRRNLRESAREGEEGENDSEGKWEQRSLAWPWHINSASEAGKNWVFLVLWHQCGAEWANTADTQRTWHTQAAVVGAEMATIPQAIFAGTILRDEVITNLTQLWDGKTGWDETGLFVQQIGTTRSVTGIQLWGQRKEAAINILLWLVRSLVSSHRCADLPCLC